MFVLHSCDNKRCVNPEHLRYGTHAENMQEISQRGTPHAGHKLKAEDVRLMRTMFAEVKLKDIAKRFGVSIPLVSCVKRGTLWGHLT